MNVILSNPRAFIRAAFTLVAVGGLSVCANAQAAAPQGNHKQIILQHHAHKQIILQHHAHPHAHKQIILQHHHH